MTRLEWARESENHEGDLEWLLEFLQNEISRSKRSQSVIKQESHSAVSGNKIKGGPRQATTAALPSLSSVPESSTLTQQVPPVPHSGNGIKLIYISQDLRWKNWRSLHATARILQIRWHSQHSKSITNKLAMVGRRRLCVCGIQKTFSLVQYYCSAKENWTNPWSVILIIGM